MLDTLVKLGTTRSCRVEFWFCSVGAVWHSGTVGWRFSRDQWFCEANRFGMFQVFVRIRGNYRDYGILILRRESYGNVEA